MIFLLQDFHLQIVHLHFFCDYLLQDQIAEFTELKRKCISERVSWKPPLPDAVSLLLIDPSSFHFQPFPSALHLMIGDTLLNLWGQVIFFPELCDPCQNPGSKGM